MYTTVDRENLLNQLIAYCKAMEDVQGFLIVGSGAIGFRDSYSDLDVLIVTEKSEDATNVQEKLHDFIYENYEVIKSKIYRHEEDIYVTCYFLDIFLELDLGVWSYKKLRATKPNWKLIFDKHNHIQRKLEESLKDHKTPKFEEVVNDSLGYIWQFVHSANVAMQRNNFIKAAKDIDVIRNQIISFICIQNKSYYDYEKNIYQLNTPFVARLQKTYEIKMTTEGMKRTLSDVMKLYFDVIHAELGDQDDFQNDKHLFAKYLVEQGNQ